MPDATRRSRKPTPHQSTTTCGADPLAVEVRDEVAALVLDRDAILENLQKVRQHASTNRLDDAWRAYNLYKK